MQLKFAQHSKSFHTELKNRVNAYFENNGISATGNFLLYFKAILFGVALITLYVHLVFYTPVVWLAIVESVMLGGVISAIGFNVMHDGAHGSFSKHKPVNVLAAYSLNILGGSSFMWNVKHNIIHHAYTNIDGVDDDIDIQPWMRMSTTQKKYGFHKYQHRYFWVLYALLYIFWIFILDYSKYFKKKIGEMPLKKMHINDHVVFWLFKALHLFVFVGLPIYQVGFLPWLIGFLSATIFAGLVLSIVFQLAHTVEHTHFPMPSEDDGKMSDEWAVHQLKTTANFATNNKLISFLVGGLNFQVEHHLFPKISHVHYPAISKIIRSTCEEFNVPYIEYPKMREALRSHVLYLKEIGRAA
ncbi:MAG: fatty acid desaturase family protein [Bacteroidota bacterium]|jgi:linoleoyl-CoA desaturase